MMEEGNLEKWTGKMAAWEKRVHLTHMLAGAWEKVCSTFDFERVATKLGMLPMKLNDMRFSP